MKGTNGVAGTRCGVLTWVGIMNYWRAGNVSRNEMRGLQMCPESNGTCKDGSVR